jgi:hypothetical protein
MYKPSKFATISQKHITIIIRFRGTGVSTAEMFLTVVIPYKTVLLSLYHKRDDDDDFGSQLYYCTAGRFSRDSKRLICVKK